MKPYFYKMVINILDILCSNTPQLYTGYTLKYSFNEYKDEKWNLFITEIDCNQFYLNRLQNDEIFYLSEDYNWMPEILKIEKK